MHPRVLGSRTEPFTRFSIGNQKVWASCTFSSPFQGFLPGLPVWSLEEDPQ